MEGRRRPGSSETTRRAPSLSLTSLTIVALASAIVLLGAGSSYAAKPAPKLTSALCATLGGTWAGTTCTIAGPAKASSSFLVPAGTSLAVDATEMDQDTGCVLSVVTGVTITVAAGGTIAVANTPQYANGVCNFGTIANLGAIDIQNSSYSTTGLYNYAAVTNEGAITIENGGDASTGIANAFQPADGGYALATLANSGTLTINNTGEASTGLQNFGAMTNSGTLAVAESLGANAAGFVLAGGTFTNERSGTLTNDGGIGYDPSDYTSGQPGFSSGGGTMLNFGTANNNGSMTTWGWAMLTYGTINNRGLLYQGSGELVNYGTVHNYGFIRVGAGAPDYPHNRGICINEILNEVTGSGC